MTECCPLPLATQFGVNCREERRIFAFSFLDSSSFFEEEKIGGTVGWVMHGCVWPIREK